MALLSTCLTNRSVPGIETNLVTGRVYAYTEGTMYTPLCTGFCWVSPGTGTAKIEMWGAGGSGARMCCCGGGVAGNAAAYSARTVSVVQGCYVCGTIGRSCNNASSICYRGCSDSSGLCWFGGGTNGCMCAQGGNGGWTFCSTSTSIWCCLYSMGLCGDCINGSCGTICNTCSGGWIGCGYGGTTNCCGPFSCVLLLACDPPASTSCCRWNYVAHPAGMFGTRGGTSASPNECDSEASMAPGNGMYQYAQSLSGLSRSPTIGPIPFCWTSSKFCGCYDMQGCSQNAPYGSGGLPATPCGEVRDNGWRGGMGLVRITYSGTNI